MSSVAQRLARLERQTGLNQTLFVTCATPPGEVQRLRAKKPLAKIQLIHTGVSCCRPGGCGKGG